MCGLGGELLSLDDDPLLGRDGLDPGPVPRRLVLLLAHIGLPRQRIQPALESLEVADGLRLVDRGMEPGDGRLGLASCEVGGIDPALEQAHLCCQRVVSACEKGERLIRASCLPDPDYTLTL